MILQANSNEAIAREPKSKALGVEKEVRTSTTYETDKNHSAIVKPVPAFLDEPSRLRTKPSLNFLIPIANGQ